MICVDLLANPMVYPHTCSSLLSAATSASDIECDKEAFADPEACEQCKEAMTDLQSCVLKAIKDDTTGTKASEWDEMNQCLGAAGDEAT